MAKRVDCPICYGTGLGKTPAGDDVLCSYCVGTGGLDACKDCRGTGKTGGGWTCMTCAGSGTRGPGVGNFGNCAICKKPLSPNNVAGVLASNERICANCASRPPSRDDDPVPTTKTAVDLNRIVPGTSSHSITVNTKSDDVDPDDNPDDDPADDPADDLMRLLKDPDAIKRTIDAFEALTKEREKKVTQQASPRTKKAKNPLFADPVRYSTCTCRPTYSPSGEILGTKLDETCPEHGDPRAWLERLRLHEETTAEVMVTYQRIIRDVGQVVAQMETELALAAQPDTPAPDFVPIKHVRNWREILHGVRLAMIEVLEGSDGGSSQ